MWLLAESTEWPHLQGKCIYGCFARTKKVAAITR